MKEILCINDIFSPEWEIYFQKQGIVKPTKDSIYTIREFINFIHGEKGLLLNEIVNKPTPRTGPISGIAGEQEQSWSISRFTDLLGKPLEESELKKQKKPNLVSLTNKEESNISYLNLN